MAEGRVTVAADRGRDHVGVVVRVEEACHERVAGVVGVVRRDGLLGTGLHAVPAQDIHRGEVRCRHRVRPVLVLLGVLQQGDVYVVLAELALPADHVIELPFVGLLVLARSRAAEGLVRRRLRRVVVVVFVPVEIRSIVHLILDAERKVDDGIEAGIERLRKLAAVDERIFVEGVERVVVARGIAEVGAVLIHRENGVWRVVLTLSVVGLQVSSLAFGELCVHADGHPVGNLRLEVEARAQVGVAVADDYALAVGVSYRPVVRRMLVVVGYAGGVVLLQACLVYYVVPIGFDAGQIVVLLDGLELQTAEPRAEQRLLIGQRGDWCGLIVVVPCEQINVLQLARVGELFGYAVALLRGELPLLVVLTELDESLAVEYVDGACAVYEADVGIERYCGPSAAALLGVDTDYAVGRLGTVDGGRRGVLQHVDALHVIGVDVGDRTVVDHSVEDDQRRRAGRQRGRTADRIAARGLGVGRHADVETRGGRTQKVADRTGCFRCKFLGIDC